MNYIKHVLRGIKRLLSRKWICVFFNKEKLPVEGDTITVGNMRATFKKIKD